MTKRTFKRAFRDSLPILAGYLALGFGFGVLLESKGYSFWWAILMSITMFAGFSLLDKYKGMGAVKPYLIFGLTDETYSVVCSAQLDDTISKRKYYFFLTALDHLYWITGCTLGAIIGGVLPFSNEGIDYAMTALFIVIMVEQWLSTKEHLPAILGVATTAVCLFAFGPDMFIIPAMTLIAFELVILRRKLDKTQPEPDGGTGKKAEVESDD